MKHCSTMRRVLFITLILLGTLLVDAQNHRFINISMESRNDYLYTTLDRERQNAETGFKGYILNMIIRGEISSNFSYMYRQRLNAINRNTSFFDSIDMLFLNYHATDQVKLSVGKAPVFIGGWELDLAPIDCFFLSSFNYQYSPYQWGVSVEYSFPGSGDALAFQFSQSPFQADYVALTQFPANMYAYSLKWQGRHGFFEPNWSVNMLEYAPGKFINYISLGNRFHISDQVQLEVDYMNRAIGSNQRFVGDNFTLVGKLKYQPIEQLNIYAKGTYDLNRSENDADMMVVRGTDLVRVGGGIEYYPLRDRSVRLHGHYSYSFGTNPLENAYVRDKLSMLNVGVSWRVNVM